MFERKCSLLEALNQKEGEIDMLRESITNFFAILINLQNRYNGNNEEVEAIEHMILEFQAKIQDLMTMACDVNDITSHVHEFLCDMKK